MLDRKRESYGSAFGSLSKQGEVHLESKGRFLTLTSLLCVLQWTISSDKAGLTQLSRALFSSVRESFRTQNLSADTVMSHIESHRQWMSSIPGALVPHLLCQINRHRLSLHEELTRGATAPCMAS